MFDDAEVKAGRRREGGRTQSRVEPQDGRADKLQVLAGFHAVQGRLKVEAASIDRVYYDDQRQDARLQALLKQAETLGVRASAVPRQRLDGMAGALRHQGVLAMAQPRAATTWNFEEVLDRVLAGPEPALLLVLDGVTDPHNLGACLRCADGAGAQAIIAPRDRSAPLNEVAIRTAAGAADAVPYIQVTNLARTLRELQQEGVQVVGTSDQAPNSLWAHDLRGPVALVLGAEGQGMRRLTREHCDALVSLPMAGSCESLNVGVAAGITLFEARRQRS